MQGSGHRSESGGRVVSLALQQALHPWDGLLEQLPVAVYACDVDGVLVQFNRRAAELWDIAPDVGDPVLFYGGAFRNYAADGSPMDAEESPMAEVLRTGAPIRDQEMIVERTDGSRSAVIANVDPLFDHTGQIVGGLGCLQDITALKRATEDLRAHERSSRELLDALPAAIYTTDAEGRITYYNRAAADLAGTEPVLGSDRWCVTWKIYNTDGSRLPHEQCPMAVALATGEAVRGIEAVAERPDGVRVPFMPYPTPLRDGSGKITGAVNMLVDISHQKRAEEQHKVLIDELNHRVKNTLTTVQSIARQTARGAQSLEAFSNKFEARLMALSSAHDFLSKRKWEGASLHDILARVLGSVAADDPERVLLDGPLLTLTPRAAVALSMVFHELAANAARHGALSRPDGRVQVSWRLRRQADEPPALVLSWREVGGPHVTPPVSTGFGARMVERTIEGEMEGRCDVRFLPRGVRCDIVMPMGLAVR